MANPKSNDELYQDFQSLFTEKDKKRSLKEDAELVNEEQKKQKKILLSSFADEIKKGPINDALFTKMFESFKDDGADKSDPEALKKIAAEICDSTYDHLSAHLSSNNNQYGRLWQIMPTIKQVKSVSTPPSQQPLGTRTTPTSPRSQTSLAAAAPPSAINAASSTGHFLNR